MTTTTFQVPPTVHAPRGAAPLANLVVAAIRLVSRLGQSVAKPATPKVATQADVAEVRAIARQYEKRCARMASELYAAADRHEIQHG